MVLTCTTEWPEEVSQATSEGVPEVDFPEGSVTGFAQGSTSGDPTEMNDHAPLDNLALLVPTDLDAEMSNMLSEMLAVDDEDPEPNVVSVDWTLPVSTASSIELS